jgi:H+-transporting ATPase
MTAQQKQTSPPGSEEAQSAPPKTSPPADIPLDELQKELGTSPEGLSQEEARRRLEQYGPNELVEKSVSPWLRFLAGFWGPIPWMIEVAAILSAVVRHWADFIIILVLLVMNAVVRFWEEYQAGNAIAALKAKLALHARAKRDAAWKTIPVQELVPGDVVRMRIGDVVPADARLFDGDPIQVDQSALTGESLPVERKPGETVYSGSVVKQGEIDALVYATGAKTYFGKTAQLVQEAHTESHFQRAVLKIGDYLIVIAVALVVLILAMPTVLSVTMAVGARLLTRKEAIVSHLPAIEEMAGVDVLCSDKTGTLTKNELTLGEPFCASGISREDLILAAALASRREDDDPIDAAVLAGLEDRSKTDQYHIKRFQPFDPVHKRTEAEVEGPDGSQFNVTKGAPQVIMAIAKDADGIKTQSDDAINKFASRGFRSLGVARTDKQGDWKFLGVLPLYDPPRDDSKATIQAARDMGIKLKMVTGDQLAIAKETAAQLGLGRNILDASAFGDASHHEGAQLDDAIERADGFAQVFPEHKYHIVEVLQKRGHITGMTGDGVNDAPALKKADAGVAVAGSTDAARAAADIVLLTPGLSVIIDAIRESRKVFQRMNTYAIYRIAETTRVLLFMAMSILIFNFYPVTAVMIVLLALLNDGPILSIAYDRTRCSDKPEAWNMPAVLGISTVLGIAGVVASFLLFYLAEDVFRLDRNVIQTFMFLKLAVAGHLTIFLTRTRGPFWTSAPAPVLLWTAVATKFLATLAAVYGLFMAPIGWQWALLIWGYALVWFLVNDGVKLLAYRVFDHQGKGLLCSSRRTIAGRGLAIHTRPTP